MAKPGLEAEGLGGLPGGGQGTRQGLAAQVLGGFRCLRGHGSGRGAEHGLGPLRDRGSLGHATGTGGSVRIGAAAGTGHPEGCAQGFRRSAEDQGEKEKKLQRATKHQGLWP